tara:strand:- start:39 stop:626 length:588 start_codon:yes stop_codon:yes gene_type:complete
MTLISALNNAHIPGFYGNYKNKDENNLIKISEIKNLLIVQIVQYKNSSIKIEELKIDELNLKNEPLSVVNSSDTRILWNGPKNWLLISTKKNLIKKIKEVFKDNEFAVTDLSHSKAIIEIEGFNSKEILKKGCPFNFKTLDKNNSINSTFNGIALTIDCIDDNPEKIRLFVLRSFGESMYHSITDSALEFGYIAV